MLGFGFRSLQGLGIKIYECWGGGDLCSQILSLWNIPKMGGYYLIYVCSFVCLSILVLLSKLIVCTSPPKPLKGLSSYFQGMFPQTPSCASSHYFSNMSVHLSVNQLSISLSYFH